MTPGVIPALDPLPLPAPAWLLWSLLVLTFLLHLVAMNVVLGGAVLALNARVRGSAPHRALATWLAKALPIAIAAAVTLGVAPLLFVQVLYGRLFFPSAVLMARYWLAVIPLVLVAYYAAYLVAFRGERLRGWATGLVLVMAATFVTVAFIYTNNLSFMLRPDAFLAAYHQSASGTHLNWDDPTLWPRYLHFLLGAIAVAGLVVAELGLYKSRRDATLGRWLTRHGAGWFIIATLANIVAGAWWLVRLPRGTLLRFMGTDPVAMTAFVTGVLLSMVALGLVAMSIPAERPRALVRGGTVALVATLVAMVLMRDQVRAGAFEAAGFQVNAWQQPQWGPIGFFAVLLVAAVGTVVWMVAVFVRSRPVQSGTPTIGV